MLVIRKDKVRYIIPGGRIVQVSEKPEFGSITVFVDGAEGSIRSFHCHYSEKPDVAWVEVFKSKSILHLKLK